MYDYCCLVGLKSLVLPLANDPSGVVRFKTIWLFPAYLVIWPFSDSFDAAYKTADNSALAWTVCSVFYGVCFLLKFFDKGKPK